MKKKKIKVLSEEEWVKKPKIDTFKERFSIKQLFKNQKKRILAFVLSLLTFASTMTTATPAFAADTINFQHGKSLVSYTYNPQWQTANGDYHGNCWGTMRFMHLNDGTPVYCIQIYEGSTEGDTLSGTTQDIRDTVVWDKELTPVAKTIITRASIYGYDGTLASRNGYTAEEAYMATQIIIWEAEIGIRTNYSQTLTSFASDTLSSNAQACYKAILAKMADHQTRPSYSSSSVTLNGTGEANAKTITDNNGVLNQFQVVSSTNSDIKASISGNNLKVWCTSAGNYNGTITLRKKNTDENTGGGTALAINGTGQKKLCGKIDDPVNSTFRVNVEAFRGKVRVKKVDPNTNANISGATIVVKELSVDSSGNKTYINPKTLTYNSSTGYYESDWLYVTDANSGWFQIVETKAPNGYLATNKYESFSSSDVALTGRAGAFQITESNNNKTATITLKEDPVTATVKFQKFWAHTDRNGNLVDENNNFFNEAHRLGSTEEERTILDSLNLEVRQYNKDTNKFDPTGIPITFDAETGYFEAQGLTYTTQNQGWFKVYENYNGTATPIALIANTSNMVMKWNKANGYNVNNFGAFRIQLDENGNPISGKTFYLYYTDPVQYGDVVIQKTADDNFVQGIEFLLEGTSTLGEEISYTATTDKDGIAKKWYDKDGNLVNSYDADGSLIKGIPVGNYTITELATDEMKKLYIIPDEEAVEIKWDEIEEEEIHNSSTTGTVSIHKDAPDDGKVEGVKLHLYGQADNGAVIDEYAITDKNGNAVFNHCTLKNSNFAKTEYDGILVGTYTIEEVGIDGYDYIPEWYVIEPSVKQTVSIEKDKDTKVTFTNKLKYGNLDVQKITDDGVKEGFGFRLSGISWSGETVNEYAVTDKNGIAHFKNILLSNPDIGYTLHEETYPSWYTPEGDKTVFVGYNIENIPYTYHNNLTRGSLEVQKVIEDIPENAAPIADKSGFEFTLTGTSDSGEKINMSRTTGKNGKVSFNDVLVGTYKLTETKYPDWYTPQYADGLTVRIDNNNGNPIKVSFDNYFKRGCLEILKSIKNAPDYVTISDLSGFEFTLSGTSDSGNKINLTAVTDSNGKAKFDDVLIGNYIITETKYPNWYTPQYPDGLEVRIDETYDPIEVSFENYPKLGDLVVIKAAEDGVKEGFKFRLYGTSDSGDDVDVTLSTNAEGWVVFNNIPIGEYTIEEVETPVKYVQPVSQKVTINWNERTELWTDKDAFSTDAHSVAHFDNTLKKFRVEVTKFDSEKTYAQGNAALENAVYGIYKGDKLVDTYNTDENGSFTTKYYICDDDWTVREIEPSEGYLIDETVYKVGSESDLYEIEHNTAPAIDSPEDIIKGDMAIIKHSDNGDTQIETPEIGATFEVYLKSAGSYDNADPDERDLLVCDELGFAKTKLLPYGVYTVHQTSGFFEAEFVPDFDVFIQKNGETKNFLINNKPFESHIKVEKKDAETHKNIPYAGAGFQIYDPDGNLVTMKLTYPTHTVIDTFYTDGNGEFTTPEKLPAGTGYKLVEVQAPYGYVLDSTPIEFDVKRGNSESDFDNQIIVIKLNKYDMPQKGVLTIYKEGEVFSSVKEKDGLYTPVFANSMLSDAEYEIYAAEDIITPDGTLRYNENDLVDTVKTNKDGIAETKELYLGKYKVVEKTAPDTFLIDTKEYEVEFTYQGQEIVIVTDEMNRYDERQKVEISLKKVLEKNDIYNVGNNDEILNVEFGVFANEDIEAKDGTVIPKHGLICSAFCDENGSITFPCDLPIGYKFYVQEIATDDHYRLDDTKYKFNTNYAGQDTDVIHIDINDGEPIENNLIAGDIEITKRNDDGELMQDVKFGIFKENCEEFTEENAVLVGLTDEKGKLRFENVPYGDYKIVELSTSKNYIPNTEPIIVSNKTGGETVKIDVVNTQVKGVITVSKEGEIFWSVNDKNEFIYKVEKLSDAHFDIYAAEDIYSYENAEGILQYHKGDKVQSIVTDENGIAKSDELYLGKYIVVETDAPKGFAINTEEFEVNLDYNNRKEDRVFETVSVSNARQKVELNLTKVMEENDIFHIDGKDTIKNVTFGIFADEAIVALDGSMIAPNTLISTAKCDESGKVIFNSDLPLGYGFYIKEIATDAHYIISDEIFKFRTDYAGQDVQTIYPELNKGEPLYNELIKGDVYGSKTNQYGDPIQGAEFGLFYENTTEFTKENAILTAVSDEKGHFEFNDVIYGKYVIKELSAPKDFILSDEIKNVFIKENGQKEEIEFENTLVKGIISVTKEGEVFYSVSDKEDSTKNFIYQTENLKNAEFDIIAAEDIWSYERSEGILRYKEGNVVQTIKTDENGIAKSEELYLGKYKVVEKTAPDGFKINTNVFEISLDFENRNNDIVYSDITVNNTRQKASISLIKEMEKDEVFDLGDKNEIENVVFGLFSDEEMTSYDGTVVPKDTILSMAKTDKDGYLEFDIDIPYGYKYYVQEIATDNHYSLSDEKFYFEFETDNRDILGLDFSINDGKVIINYLKRGTIDVNKFGEINASDDTIPLSDTVFGLFYTDCTEFTEENAIITVKTDEFGYAKFEFVDYGEYLVKEIQAHEGYVVSDEVFTVTISEDAQNEVIDVLNDLIKSNVSVQKVDADFTERNLEGAVFKLYNDVDNNGAYDENIDTLYGTLDDLSEGLYEIFDVPYGHYLLKEETAPHGFSADENYYPVFICEDGATYDLTNNGEFFINDAETGELKIIKTSSDGIVEGFEFLIEGISEAGTEISITAKTDKDGIINIPAIRTGTYTISEINVPERYVVPEPQEITITNDETAEVHFFNKVITGTIEITKTDVVTGDPLPGTLIEILDSNGVVIRGGETDENGKITFDKLPYGTYFYKESKAPEGYIIDETPHEFTISEEGQIIKAIMTNQAIETTPDTGTNIVYVAGAAVGLTAVLGILLIAYKRKKDTVTE